MAEEIPTLGTERLVLRPMRAGDWPAYGAFMASERARYMGGPFDTEGAWGIFCSDHAQWSLFGVGSLMIEERATGAVLGSVGINSGPLFPEWELGWMVYPGAEGLGIAFEAAAALRDWARDRRGLETLVSYVDAENTRSRRLADRLGAVLDPAAPRNDPADLVYRHFRRA
ncbi:Protein N-acetyltransferase, RimJ/RimL family [Pseudooceanicola antarcticus]|uniref:N-acetyltransferase n=1 Tax=Pseudooceanicola antarcticus TaxID=1247613 RepID=A0A285IXA1_9RHOB|nr:GNAT family N-acetyltransferase [Pseudooceanicola antarcticus]PJE25859.1 N-acetyltransferase [Pseudooceanicola antarcticus]SNY52578.1 Protein N-acetyltransferase, RimJ/RimL family [Pseudooceanicola antarcticus]